MNQFMSQVQCEEIFSEEEIWANAANIQDVVSAEYLELEGVKVVFRDWDEAEVTEYFDGIAFVEAKYGEEIAEEVEELLNAE